ncbi:nucleic acid dioxygenase ALKBH1-like [Diadema setosum]|uniref:nucleic acid dioxygenase ALKBH1-like n=1 Tax=Diadema setosum TaxID=31175 RepID=UPI003B3A0E9D
MDESYEDHFRPEFQRYKKKQPPPDMHDVLDVDDEEKFNGLLYKLNPRGDAIASSAPSISAKLGLTSPFTWRCHAVHGYPGFQYIRNPFLPKWQRYWVKRCIADYPCKPNVTNMDAHAHESSLTNPWEASKQNFCMGAERGRTVIDQLRWVTLGYHYDWNDKVYHEDSHSPFPEDLHLISSFIARVLGYDSFQPQAAIVNFYHMDSTLGGHTDHSEFDLTAPLISYSFGQSAILLVGGQTKATKPLALHLRSGDVVVLGGASRLAYHAVPRIMYASEDGQLPPCFSLSERDSAGNCKEEDMKASGDAEVGGNHESITGEVAVGSVDGRPSEVVMETNSPDACTPQEMSEDNGAIGNGDSAEKNSSVMTHACQIRPPSNQCQPGSEAESNSDCGVLMANSVLHKHCSITAAMSSEVDQLCSAEQWEPIDGYLRNARINVSVRQVTGPGKGFPPRDGGIAYRDNHDSKHNENKKMKAGDG